jgi:membrane-associated phospholipid phosphatase
MKIYVQIPLLLLSMACIGQGLNKRYLFLGRETLLQHSADRSVGWLSPMTRQNYKSSSFRYYNSGMFLSPYLVFYNLYDSAKLKWTDSKAFRISIAPATLITAGALTWSNRENIREARNRFIPDFENHFDDVTQFIPGLAVYALNAAGVKGKHSVARATASMAIGAAITSVIVTTLKYTTNVVRPDESASNSFPSGHTATSVVSATFLHKEYGQYRSPLYSIGAYSMAGATAVGRQINNRHWISDVLVGAGIGLISTEIGYLIADGIYKDRGLNAPLEKSGYDKERGRPSFVLVKIGYANANKDLTNQDNDLVAEQGYSFGFEGAYFFNNSIGLGMDLSFAGFPIQTSGRFSTGDPDIDSRTEEYVTDAMGTRSVFVGPYLNIVFNKDLALVTRFTIGPSYGAQGGIYSRLTEVAAGEVGENEVQIITYTPESTTGWGTGVAVRKMVGRNIGINLFWDFYYSKPTVTWSEADFENGDFVVGPTITTEKTNFSYNSFGISVSAMLW